jgi:queuosine precursor transporter
MYKVNNKKDKKNTPSTLFLPLLCMLFLMMDIMSYLYVYYIIDIFHIILSCSVFFFTATYIIMDIVVEVYGYSYARQIIWFSLICEAFFSISIFFLAHLHLNAVVNNSNINILLSKNIIRIFLTSIFTTPIGDFINSFALSKWKILLKGKFFILRSILSSALGVIVYCVLAHTMLFWKVLNIQQLTVLILSSIVFKLLLILIFSIPSALIVFILKKLEGKNIYDTQINYNPFKLN